MRKLDAHKFLGFHFNVIYFLIQVKFALKTKFIKNTAQKMKFFIKDFFSICDKIRRKLRIWSHLLKKSLMVSFFCAVKKAYIFLQKF